MSDELEYVGFWARTGAALIDLLLQIALTAPLTMAVYGSYVSAAGDTFQGMTDVLINLVLPAIAVIVFWIYKGATPGKMAISARVVDADSGEPVTGRQAVLRYIGYVPSLLPLGLGCFWVAFDRRKQGWHDKIAGTVVVRRAGKEPVRFERGPSNPRQPVAPPGSD